ncbi:MAG: chemotaxis protein CheD [Candidatus Sericytochromatia bacterium]|nr:chemotaxis protein CheD [Candidatus Tanganyikabacteria bacterium]
MRDVPMATWMTSDAVAETLRIVGLGSCVAVVLRAVRKPLVGVGHFMLPARSQGVPEDDRDKFVDSGIVAMAEALGARGVPPAALEALVAGGARMFRGFGGGPAIGIRNVAAARETLDLLGIAVVAGDVGGVSSRNLLVAHCGQAVSVAYPGQTGHPVVAWRDAAETTSP